MVVIGDGEDRMAVETLARSLGVAIGCEFSGIAATWRHGMRRSTRCSWSRRTKAHRRCDRSARRRRARCGHRVGGTASVVDDGETGSVVPIGDVAHLAARLRELQDDPAQRAQFGRLGSDACVNGLDVAHG